MNGDETTLVLPAGTVVKVHGMPFVLTGAVSVAGTAGNLAVALARQDHEKKYDLACKSYAESRSKTLKELATIVNDGACKG